MYMHIQESVMVAAPSANRVAPYFDEPRKQLPPPPATPEARSAALADAVFAAVLALQGQLTHHDPDVVHRAAVELLDFEKTRLRHGRNVIGTTPPTLDPDPPGGAQDDAAEAGADEPNTEPTTAEADEPDADDELADIWIPPVVPASDRAAYRDYVQDVREVLTVAYNQSGLKRAVSLSEASEVAQVAVSMRFQGQCEERKRLQDPKEE